MVEAQHLIIGGLALVWFGATVALVGVVWQQRGAPNSPTASTPSNSKRQAEDPSPTESQRVLTPQERAEAAYNEVRERRRKLEESLVEVGGQAIFHKFDETRIGMVTLSHNEKDYTVQISQQTYDGVWVNNRSDGVKEVFVEPYKKIGELIDIRELKAVRDAIVKIGHRAIYRMTDGVIFQLRVVSVRYDAEIDDTDEVRLRYKSYGPDVYLIEAL